jgi:preprotein translocase subunit SecD
VYLEINFMKKMMLVALLSSALMAQNRPITNGIYAVVEGNGKAKNRVIRHFGGRDIVLDAASFVPLVVDGKPEVQRDPRGSSLMIQLAPEAAKRLEELTRSHMNQPIAVVVGDKILSTPTVRSVIQDGKAKVTPCEDASCESLVRQLGK